MKSLVESINESSIDKTIELIKRAQATDQLQFRVNTKKVNTVFRIEDIKEEGNELIFIVKALKGWSAKDFGPTALYSRLDTNELKELLDIFRTFDCKFYGAKLRKEMFYLTSKIDNIEHAVVVHLTM